MPLRQAGLSAHPAASEMPTLWPGLPLPFGLLTPVAPQGLALPAQLPTEAPTPTPTPRPSPTPLPTPTPMISLEELRQMPVPSTSVLQHPMHLPPGFDIEVYVEGLDSASYMAYADDEVLFVTLPERGAVVAIAPSEGPAQPEQVTVWAEGLTMPSGVAFYDGYVYVAEAHQVVRLGYRSGDLERPTSAEVIVPNLPLGNGPKTHAIGFGPDGKLYVSVSASCNACREADYRRATILRYNPDGTDEQVVAQGLRDVGDMTWYPNSNQLLATNTSRRRMGEDLPPDTLEIVFDGLNFGWPFCHAGDIVDQELGWPGVCDEVPRPLQQLPAHTTPKGVCVYTGGQFPVEYHGDILVALYGSWERRVPVGYKIVRLDVEDGQVVGQEDFISGWLVYTTHWGRPVDLIQAPDGSLLISDQGAGAIYRVYWEGE